jgi:hypothetical protein
MTTIYRVQNNQGKGCYRGLTPSMNIAVQKILGTGYDLCDNKHPAPQWERGIDRFPHKYEICGFQNVRQALKWFSAKEIRGLRRLGFELVQVQVQRITAIGTRQILAIK